MSFVSNVFISTVQDDPALTHPSHGSQQRQRHQDEERHRAHAAAAAATASSGLQSSYGAGISLPGDHERRATSNRAGVDHSTASLDSDDDDDDADERNDLLLDDRLDERVGVLPAFVARLTGTGARQGGGGCGWRAYESIVPGAHAATAATTASHVVFEHAHEDDDSEEEEEDEPVPGAFVDAGAAAKSNATAEEPPERPQVLHVYPVPGPTERLEREQNAYRDSGWIVAYGVSLLAVVALALQAWWTSPPPAPPSLPHSPSRALADSLVYSALPNLIALAFVSAAAGLATVLYLSTIRHLLPTLLSGAVYAGPALCLTTACLALYGSFGTEGVAIDRGWQVGVRWFAVLCCAMAVVCGRSVYARQKELQRAVNVGQLACQTVIDHPSLRLFIFCLSALSVLISFPFFALITTLLTYAPTSPRTASYGTAWTLLVYLWTLAIARGMSHAVVGGCVGTWYFEREDQEYVGPVEVTRASIARATGPSLGTVIAASFFVAVFSTLATLLRSLRRFVQSSRLPSFLSPLTSLAPVFAALAGWAAFFNSYALSYAGMTGEGFWSASRETRELFRANRARNIQDTALLRLTLFITSSTWGLFTGLITFFITSYHLSPSSGGYTPTLALLCYAVPMYTLRLCHNVIGDAVDALFVCTHLDAENEVSHCPKAVEAFVELTLRTIASQFGTPETIDPHATLPF